MAVTKNGTKYAVKVEYKTEYDTTGDFATLPAYSQTFGKVSESATVEQLKNFADILMGLTIYRGSPYKVYLIDTANLVVA